MYQLRPFLVGVVRVLGHPERSFEGLLQLLVPLGVGDKHQLTCKDGDGVNLRVLGLSPRSLSAFCAARTIAMNLSSVVREEAFSVELHQPADRRLTESHDFYRCSIAAQPVTENTFSHDFRYAIVTFFFYQYPDIVQLVITNADINRYQYMRWWNQPMMAYLYCDAQLQTPHDVIGWQRAMWLAANHH